MTSDKNRARHKALYRRRAALLNKLKDYPCNDCGVKYPPCVMDFHHREPTTKVNTVGQLMNSGFCNMDKVLAEIAKCDLICANCHRIRTYGKKELV